MSLNNDSSNEKNLVLALIAGEEDAYRRIINTYRKPVLRLCNGFTGSSEDAEDLAQDIFIEVFNSINKFKARSSLSTWIYRIAVNKSLNYIRDRKKRKYEMYSPSGDMDNDSHQADSPDYRLMQKDHAYALHNAIDSLPAAQRTAFILNKYDDLKYAEIAEIMNTSISSVESLLFRAKRNLQKRLHDYYRKNLK